MTITLQKANIWKRISAYMFDAILCVMIAVGFAAVLASVFRYDDYQMQLEQYYQEYETQYGIEFDITDEEFNKFTQEQKDVYETATKAFAADQRVLALYDTMFYVTLAIISGGVLLAHLILYFAIPLFFKDGKTLGKKIFGLAVVRTNCVQITPPVLFIRAIIGQCVMETLVPVLFFVMIYFGLLGSVGVITLIALFILQLGVMIATKTNSSIHDLLTDTVVVDYASQLIFPTEDDRIAYIKELQRQEAEAKEYPFTRGADDDTPSAPVSNNEI